MRQTFVKTRPDAPEHFFAAEAAGLRWLRVADGVAVAGVHEVTRTSLRIDRVDTSTASASAAEEFGRRLATTHDAGAAFFGIGPDGGPGVGWIGTPHYPCATAHRNPGAPGTAPTGCVSMPNGPGCASPSSTG